jgi:phospholipid/cholesterol/gamma-HCH transport system permease protein
MDVIDAGSLRIVVVALLCVGGAVVLNSASQFRRFGETVLTADAVSLALLRELGPVFTALLIAGRNATAMAAELGSMVVTEQVEAIRAFGIDPVRKLMTPRVLATVLVLPLLVALGNYAGWFGGFLMVNLTMNLSAEEFWTRAIKCAGFRRPLYKLHETNCFRIHHRDRGLLSGIPCQRRDRERGPRCDCRIR